MHARHGRQRRPGPWRTILAAVASVLAVVTVSGASLAAVQLGQLQSNITRSTIPGDEGGAVDISEMEGGFNIFIAGSDTRIGQGGIGGDEASETGVLNDVNMLLHVSEDHSRAVAVSIPRDLVVEVPECTNPDTGTSPTAGFMPMNSVLEFGGMYCTVATVQQLTGVDIQFAGLIDFTGVIEMSNAVGGVDVCITAPIDDPQADLYLPEAGTVNLQGEQALAFLRSRHGVGDGSDLGRISSQQVYLSGLVRKLQDDGTLTDLGTVLDLANVATQNMELSQNFANVNTLASIALALRDIPLDQIVFVQYPGTTDQGGVYSGKVAPLQAEADQLFTYIRNDQPFTLDPNRDNVGSVADQNAPVEESPAPETGAPTTGELAPTETATPEQLNQVRGQTAAEYTCSDAYRF